MVEFLHMGWPTALVFVAMIIASVVIYLARYAIRDENARKAK